MDNAVPFAELMGAVSERSWQPDHDGLVPIGYACESGYHIYTKLRLRLDTSAADDYNGSKKYLRTIKGYAETAQAYARIYDIQILELQGEVMHFFMPCVNIAASAMRVIAFVKELHDAVKERVSNEPFVAACDYGQTVFVHEGNGSSQSVVSLSPAANAPAKELGTKPDGSVKIQSRNIVIPAEYCKGLGIDVDRRLNWVAISLENLPESLVSLVRKAIAVNDKRESYLSEANEFFKSYDPRGVFAVDKSYEYDLSAATPEAPAIVQGFFMRADLDGFTDAVERAFHAGGNAVRELVSHFSDQLKYAKAYVSGVDEGVAKAQNLPWAGDCANFLVSPVEPYVDARQYLPVKLAAKWHDQNDTDYSDGVKWRARFDDARWVVSIAGGNDSDSHDTGNSGHTLIAKIKLDHREFLIAAGWNVRRSLDGFDAEPGKEHTVLHKADYAELEGVLKDKFKLSNNYQIFYHGKVSMRNLQKNVVARHASKAIGAYAIGSSSVAQIPIRSYAE
jgi:hypothetical protein